MNYAVKASPSGWDILSLSEDARFHHSIFYNWESVFRVTPLGNLLFPWHVAELTRKGISEGAIPSVGSRLSQPQVWAKGFLPSLTSILTPLKY